MTITLEDLNEAQKEAVEHGAGPLLVFAGAGSGKTRVLTRRIGHLVDVHKVHPEQILAVTFTNKAAREMKARVDSLFSATSTSTHSGSGPRSGRGLYSPLWVSTFHSSCVRILRAHASLIDFTSQFAIYDSDDSLSTMRRVYKRLNVDPKIIDPRGILSRIDRLKNEYRFADSVRSDPSIAGGHRELIAQLYESYQEELHRSNAMDFGDLLCNVVTLFKLEPRVLEHYQSRFQYLLIDEYQDTNHVQYLLVKMLSEKHRNLCVVGDDDQSIYAFRGATIENILNFKKDFPEARTITLDINYRSTQNILAAANSVIARNERRQPKRMSTTNPAGTKLVCIRLEDEMDEARFVTREIEEHLRSGYRPSDIAVFYRTNAQSRAVEEALMERGLPYEIFGGHRFYDRKEIKDILGYVRLILNPKDNEAFLRVVNTPTRGIGDSALSALNTFAQRQGLPLLAAVEKLVTSEGADEKSAFSAAQKKKLGAFFALIQVLREDARQAELTMGNEGEVYSPRERTEALATFLQHIAERSGYLKSLRDQDSIEAESRIENILELFAVSVEFVRRCIDQQITPGIGDFLDRASLASDLDRSEHAPKAEGASAGEEAPNGAVGTSQEPRAKSDGAISLMTLHLAKGLEFDLVFLIGLEEGILPHSRSIDNRSALEEERRLCYVGITRARKDLYLTRVTNRQSFGRMSYYSGVASRFIDDLPDSVIEDRRSGFFPASSRSAYFGPGSDW